MKKMIMGIVFIILIAGGVILSRGKVEYNYTIEGKEGITDKQVGAIKARVDKIYRYLNDIGCETEKVKLVVAEYSKFKKDNKEIVIDANIDDLELIKTIMRYNFSEYTNYGLMYGTIYDMAKKEKLEFEEIEVFTIEEVQAYWKYMQIALVNFIPEVASDEEIEIAKYTSVELVKFIKEEYGNEYFLELIRESSDEYKVSRVSELLDEWMMKMDPQYSCEKFQGKEVFNRYSSNGKLEYKSVGVEWNIDFNTHEFREYHQDIYESTEVFYEYMNCMHDEMEKLNRRFDLKEENLLPLRVEFYPDLNGMGGTTSFLPGNKGSLMRIRIIEGFSHEYVHYLDGCLKQLKDRVMGEIRAEYYSRGFALKETRIQNFLEKHRKNLKETEAQGKISINPYDEVKRYTGREIQREDYYGLFNDLLVSNWIKSGENVHEQFKYKTSYPYEYWWSFSNYVVRNYGEEGMTTILLYEKHPDGSVKTIDGVKEEWIQYLGNLSEKDYENYYKED